MNNLWVFDVDGVVTHPRHKKITEAGLVDQFVRWLQEGDVLAFNTGRSLVWVEEKVIEPLKSQLANKSLLHNVFAVGEKGADWVEYSQQGEGTQTLDHSILVPEKLQKTIKNLIREQFAEIMFFDDTKKTMISIEMHTGGDITSFTAKQKELIDELAKILNGYTDLKIDPTVIATDIENKHVGKALGAERILSWLKKRNFTVDSIYTFGDSGSDIAMAEKFYGVYRYTKKIEFIFVGEKIPWDKKQMPFVVTHVPGFNKGTMKFISRIK